MHCGLKRRQGGHDYRVRKEPDVSYRVSHQDIVRKALDTKAVDFSAIGKMVAELGPSVSLADDPWENFCGTMRFFIRVYVVNPFVVGSAGSVENLGALRGATGELQT